MFVFFREYLTGFTKRKNERKKKAVEELEVKLKEERKRIKSEAKDSYKKMTKSYAAVPEIEEILAEETFETDEVSVSVVELSTTDLAKRSNWIGANKPVYSDDEVEEAVESGEEEVNELPGMELTVKKRKLAQKKEAKIVEKETEKEEEEDETVYQFKNKRELNKVIKKQATKTIKKSKAFQLKGKIDAKKMQKKSRRIKGQKEKFMKDKTKSRGGEAKVKTRTGRGGRKRVE